MPSLSAAQDHVGFSRVFPSNRLTFGLITPLEGYPASPFPTLERHAERARLAEDAGFSALWLRDVPFYDPTFGDVGQILDPFVYLGYLAATTRRITLGTAGILAPLRHAVLVAKQAASVDQLSGGRFVMGLATGDRPAEYPAMAVDFESRDARFREAVATIRRLGASSFPHWSSHYSGMLDGSLDLVPKPSGGAIPLLVIGQARQSVQWIAEHADGWISYASQATRLQMTLEAWQNAMPAGVDKPYGYATFFDLDRDPFAKARMEHGVLLGGRRALVELWKQQQEQGVRHVALNLKPTRRLFDEVATEFCENIFPLFTAA